MKDKIMIIGNPSADMGFAIASILAGRAGMSVVLTPPPRFEPHILDPGDFDEMLMHMLMPDQPRRPSLASLLSDLATLEAEAILARRPRPFRPTGNKRSRRRRKG